MGRRIVVKILVNGFEFDGDIYRSLSAIVREATGTKWNGFLFRSLMSTRDQPNGKGQRGARAGKGVEQTDRCTALRDRHANAASPRKYAGSRAATANASSRTVWRVHHIGDA